jgi:hypothetical protein
MTATSLKRQIFASGLSSLSGSPVAIVNCDGVQQAFAASVRSVVVVWERGQVLLARRRPVEQAPYGWAQVQNIKRDPFEQSVGEVQKSVMSMGGTLAAPSTCTLPLAAGSLVQSLRWRARIIPPPVVVSNLCGGSAMVVRHRPGARSSAIRAEQHGHGFDGGEEISAMGTLPLDHAGWRLPRLSIDRPCVGFLVFHAAPRPG